MNLLESLKAEAAHVEETIAHLQDALTGPLAVVEGEVVQHVKSAIAKLKNYARHLAERIFHEDPTPLPTTETLTAEASIPDKQA